MDISTEEISDLIFRLVYNNIYSQDSEIIARAVTNRFIGFRSELEFISLCRKNNRRVLSGGCFLPLRSGQATLSSPLYYTFGFEQPDYYLDFYLRLAKMKLSKLIYVTVNQSENWTNIDLFGFSFPVPSFRCYDFQNNQFINTSGFANNLSFLTNHYTPKSPYVQKLKPDERLMSNCRELIKGYEKKDLLAIYLTRLILDGFIGFHHFKGIPSDIDCVTLDSKGNFRLFEIKEKDLSKSDPIGFGIDIQRFKDCLNIAQQLQLPYYYFVRHVDNQRQRNFVGWRYISFTEFESKMKEKDVKEGASGMNTIGHPNNPTYMLGQEYFYKI